jgi:hypothetical protein
MRLSRTLLLFTLAFLGLAPMSSSSAQEAERLELANRLLVAMRFGVESAKSTGAMGNATTKTLEDMTKAGAGAFASAFADVTRRLNDPQVIRAKMAARIAGDFSDEELRQLIALYESPVTQRLLDTQSAVISENREAIIKALQGPADSLRKKLPGGPPEEEPWR